ncbi:unnamed protein product [marine sediment metagenome]|uniref:Uncharacterized protein n=1 Tax=marine sediment metagenome TaxID=412755 RepID=X1H4S5_9ZZZZ
MQKRPTTPTSLADFKAKPIRVTVTKSSEDPGDLEATRALILAYTQDDGFHCPRCGVVITNPEEAINHLAEEINKALALLGK